MDIFEFALQMEKDGEEFYRKLAETCNDIGLKNILTMLADEEVDHYRIIEQLSKRDENAGKAQSQLLDNVRNVFVRMKDENKDFDIECSQADSYRKAREIEEKSMNFYIERANESGGKEKELYLQLAEEERKHVHLMESLVDFVTEPERWLDNAEWHRFDQF